MSDILSSKSGNDSHKNHELIDPTLFGSYLDGILSEPPSPDESFDRSRSSSLEQRYIHELNDPNRAEEGEYIDGLQEILNGKIPGIPYDKMKMLELLSQRKKLHSAYVEKKMLRNIIQVKPHLINTRKS